MLMCLSGALGTACRYGFSAWAAERFGSAFPYGTFGVNFAGSFLMAALVYLGTNTTLLSPSAWLALTTGVMGGFTTYSTFSYETFRYLQQGAYGLAALNVGVTVAACLLACFLGFAAARALF